ncbi:hypothetical protein [Streptomyces dysideae]|nr:hypothetical protein [Streptomyces dysideae]
MAAAVVLLAAAVLLHFGTPHHPSAASSVVSAMAPAIESESRKASGSVSAGPHVGTGAQHHEAEAEALALPPRTGHLVEAPSLAADAVITSVAALSGTSRSRTARDARNPGAGPAPDSTALQVFRC